MGKIIQRKIITKDCTCRCEFEKPMVKADKNCRHCNGTGIVEDNIVYHFANGICIDGDQAK